MNNDNNMTKDILLLGKLQKQGLKTWVDIATEINLRYGKEYSSDTIRIKFNRLLSKQDDIEVIDVDLTENVEVSKDKIEITFDKDGVANLTGFLELPRSITSNPTLIYEYLGYPLDKYDILKTSVTRWMQHTKLQTTKELCAVKLQFKPKTDIMTPEMSAKAAYKLLNDMGVARYNPQSRQLCITDFNTNEMMFFPAVELHVGKVGYNGVSEVYNIDIAESRFFEIVDDVIETQKIYKAEKLLVGTGNDYFNFDNSNYTTTKGTQVTNDDHYIATYQKGVEMYIKFIDLALDHFKEIHIVPMLGNHDKTISMHLTEVLKHHYRDTKAVTFAPDYKLTQAYRFGKNLIVTNHGDNNTARLAKNIAKIFREMWALSQYVFLFSGHIHNKNKLQEDAGVFHTILSSPSGTDEWHEENNYNGAIPQHQYFIFDKNKGLRKEFNVTFVEKKIKKLRKV